MATFDPLRTEAGPPTPLTTAGVDRLFSTFAALFAVALSLDQLWWGGFQLRSPHVLVVAAAAWVLLRPSSVPRFAAMVTATVVSVVTDMPFVGSHRILDLVLGLAIFTHLTWTLLRCRRLPSGGEVLAATAPLLRSAVIVLYVYAALSKLNVAFLHPGTSCAAGMVRQVAWWDPSLVSGRWMAEPAIWGTILVEASLPALLAWRRTRVIGLAVGVAFHTILALAGNVPFTILVFALYVAFVPPGLMTAFPRRHLAGDARRVSRSVRKQAATLTLLAAAWVVAARVGPVDPAGLLGVPSADRARLLGDLARIATVTVACGWGLALVRWQRALRAGQPLPPCGGWSRRSARPIMAIAVVALLLNGACPYLGLKTDTSFQMFSGLRTEPGAWNSLVVPRAVRIFGYQDDQVHVVSSNEPALVMRTAHGNRLVPLELDRFLRTHPGSTATYTTAGHSGERTLDPLAQGPTLAERLAPFLDVPPPGGNRC